MSMRELHLKLGDCLDHLKEIEDSSYKAILCDPPYGLKFMDKTFDDLGEGRQQIDWHKRWLSEAYRILEKGGKLRAFCGSRTVHYLLTAMAETGFSVEIETWHYVSGFPKSLNVSLDLDRQEGLEREIIGWTKASPKGVLVAEERGAVGAGSFGGETKVIPVTKPKGNNAKNWEGWHTALKPSFEPICVGTK